MGCITSQPSNGRHPNGVAYNGRAHKKQHNKHGGRVISKGGFGTGYATGVGTYAYNDYNYHHDTSGGNDYSGGGSCGGDGGYSGGGCDYGGGGGGYSGGGCDYGGGGGGYSGGGCDSGGGGGGCDSGGGGGCD